MKYGVIDIGSNSVRLLLSDGSETFYKIAEITRLAKGMNGNGALVGKPADNTVTAVSFFAKKALADGAEKIFAFATSAVRTALNGQEFCDRIFGACGVRVEIASEETEAEIGYLGALGNSDGGIIDIGGGSTEIQVISGSKKVYSKSIPVGAVRLTDACGQEERLLNKICAEKALDFGMIPKTNFTAIGGTATTAAAIVLGLKKYDAKIIEGFTLEKSALFELKDRICRTPVEKRREIAGLQAGREEIIGSGLAFLCALYDKIGIDFVKISDKDNLEGYLIRKIKGDL